MAYDLYGRDMPRGATPRPFWRPGYLLTGIVIGLVAGPVTKIANQNYDEMKVEVPELFAASIALTLFIVATFILAPILWMFGRRALISLCAGELFGFAISGVALQMAARGL